MNNKNYVISIVLSLAALCLSVVSAVGTFQNNDTKEKDIQYVMYIGTNDKDTNEPVCSPDEAKDKVEEVLVKHFGGYTIQEAHGGWEDDGTRYQEYTVVAYLSDTDLESVHDAADKIIKEFNQSSVLIQANETSTEYYGGDQ